MTTTAQAIPALEVSAPDDNMDVLSDTGFDFGDGDIDLDLDTAPSVQDDDMSLNDVATDDVVDMEEPPADQDDFMVDHGDLIEEDDAYNDSGAAASAAGSQTIDQGANTFEADMLAPPDEDLIDYSDDEAQQQVKMHSPSVHDDEELQASYDAEIAPVPVNDQNQDDEAQGHAQPVESTENFHREAPIQEDAVAESFETTETNPEYQPVDAELSHAANEDNHVHVDDGGVPLPTDEQSYSHSDNAIAEQQEITEQQEGLQENATDGSGSTQQLVQQTELRPVTVNYAGNELWLFKGHDLEESGDFLLEDMSVAKSSMSDLFQACRLSLGDDVSGEHEIGFRFDHLHNLELYEDNTACVAVSLERLVDLYHTLQAQDGNEDPECFYVTLQFRPRFATLLADVAQYAEQGSGYSALDAAVAAGETHFSNVFSSASTEHEHVEWDDEENEDEDASSPDSDHSTAPERVDAIGQNEQPHNEAEDEQEEHEDDSSQEQQQGVDLKDAWHETPGTQDDESFLAQESADFDPPKSSAPEVSNEDVETAPDSAPATAEQDGSEPLDKRTPDQIAHDKQEADDFVDYSDDEDDQETKSVPAEEPSPSSSTVQGDEPTDTQEPSPVLERDSQDDANAAGAFFDGSDDDTTLLAQTQYGDDSNHYAFQDYTETYEQGDLFQDYQADGTGGDLFDANDAGNGNTNQDFSDYNFQGLDGEVNLGFDEQPLDEADHDDHGNETFETIEDVSHADALLDLDNAPEWAIDTDPAPNSTGENVVLLRDDDTIHGDDEGSAVGQLATETSPTGALALISSNDNEPSSPQGQKRSIDEIGDGADDTIHSADAKRPRV